MTANYIAKIVQREYEKLDIDDMLAEFKGIEKYKYGRVSDKWVNKKIQHEQYHRWAHACYILEEYIRNNFHDFEQTDLVYAWAKDLCEKKNRLFNKYRSSWVSVSFQKWLINEGYVSKTKKF